MARGTNSSTPASMSNEGSEHSLRAWMTVVGAFFTFFCSVGFINAFGTFQEYYRSHQLQQYSEFDISWIGSFATFALFAGAPPAGVLVDRIGPTVLLMAGSLALLVAIFMTSLCKEYYQFFLAQALLLGASMSFLFCPAIATVSRYFNRNKGLAVGVAVGGSSTGGVIWPIMINELLNKDGVSFGWVIRIIGFIMLPLLLLAICTIFPPPRKEIHLEECSLERGTHNAKGNGEKTLDTTVTEHTLSIIKNTTFLSLCVGLAICYLGMFGPFFYVTSYARSLGHPVSISFYMISIVNAASLIGRVLPGFVADKYGHFNLCSLMVMLSGITAFCWTAAKSVGGLVVWSLAYGFTSGAIMSLQSACAARLATHKTHGTAMGFLMGSVALTALFGTPISGQLVESYGYLALSMYTGASLVLGSILIFHARLRLDKKILVRQ